MTDPLTASDYTFLDRQAYTYNTVKILIDETLNTYAGASDRHVRGRPGIPGTLVTLNERVQGLILLKHYRIAARLIEKKVRKAYKLGNETP
jgi:hypothetical protein